MRFYGFGNYYLSSLQQGLQSAHCVSELFVKYELGSSQYEKVMDWARNHKTMVLLNGGNSANLQFIHDEFIRMQENGFNLPFVKFHEDEASLGGALTYVGVVVPEHIYENAAKVRSSELQIGNPLFWESEFILLLNQFGLAH